MAEANEHALKRVRGQFSLHVHPSQMFNVTGAVIEQLAANLLRYTEDFDGVILSYANQQVVSKQADLHPYFPYLHVTATADVVVFQPVAGMYLVGRVNHVGHDYVSCLIFDLFNASIAADQMRKDFKPRPQDSCWVNKHDPTQVISVGTLLRFKVERVLDQVSVFSIAGSLRDSGTGIWTAESQALLEAQGKAQKQQQEQQQQQQQQRPTKKKQRVEQQQGVADLNQQQQQEMQAALRKKNKKKKQVDAGEQEGPQQPQQQSMEQEQQQQQKKKKRKREQEDPGDKQQQQQQQHLIANGVGNLDAKEGAKQALQSQQQQRHPPPQAAAAAKQQVQQQHGKQQVQAAAVSNHSGISGEKEKKKDKQHLKQQQQQEQQDQRGGVDGVNEEGKKEKKKKKGKAGAEPESEKQKKSKKEKAQG